MRKLVLAIVIVLGATLALVGCHPLPGTVKDEATLAGRTAEKSFPAADDDYFRDMDYGVTKNPEAVRAALNPYLAGISAQEAVSRAVKGRNNWIVWTGGNDRFWDDLSSKYSLGTIDLLKTISSHPSLPHGRQDRWYYYGIVNEPCFKKPTGPRADRFGLWLDERVTGGDCSAADPFENEQKYPGVKYKARGTTVPVGSFYGYATGIVGLRIFPNPNFDEKAKAHWDPEKYYTDPNYYNDKDLVKPYRVGMSCGFCHVGPNPSNPPKDPENPTWANLNSNPGAQYFWVDRIFVWNPEDISFAYQLFHTSRPGALDTSFVSSDQINNPRTMNAIYNLGARLGLALKWPGETLTGGELNNKQFNDYPIPPGSPLTGFYDPATHTAKTPKVLKDGSDSVGSLGALNRVYINIGLFSEEWTLHFKPLVGGAHITPIKIADAEKNSVYWRATEMQTPDVAYFFLAASPPRSAEERARRLRIPNRRRGDDHARQGSLRRALRALPLQQAAGEGLHRLLQARLRRFELHVVLERLLEVDQDRRVQERHEDHRDGAGLRGQQQRAHHRSARSGHAARDQRLQPAGHQRHRRQHLGQLLLHRVQEPSISGIGQDPEPIPAV